MAGHNKSARGGGRKLHTRVKTAKGRKISSTRWLERQLNDPYVAEARRLGYRSRSAFKLLELDEKFDFLKPGARVLDLGACPGGWTQIAVEKVKAGAGGGSRKKGHVVALDINEMEPIAGAAVLRHDIFSPGAEADILAALGGPADVVLSDMASPATGHRQTDHLRVVALCEAAFDVAARCLSPGGIFVAKVFQGGAVGDLLALLKRDFATVRHAKPAASRSESSETYVVAQGFRGPPPAAGGDGPSL